MMAQAESDPATNPPLHTRTASLRQVGDYDLIREIGRGGTGVVFEARQKSLNRVVALKLILAGEFASETAVARFWEKAELIAGLTHPNIVPIYEVGEDRGYHFHTMALIANGSLARRLAGGREQNPAASFSPRESATLLAKVARAVHFVHQRGIIHRDLSPDNILLEAQGEPRVTDFGIARLASVDRRLTQTRGILGKADYLAPMFHRRTWPG